MTKSTSIVYLEKSRVNQLNRIFKGVRHLKSEAHAAEQVAIKMEKLFEVTREQRNNYRRALQIIANGEDPNSPGSLASAALLRRMADEALQNK